MRSLEERFWSKVDKGGPDECWLWQAATDGWGYGRSSVRGKTKLAHRVSYELEKGPIPEGLCVCHSCDVPPCVNPQHLFVGTQQDNITDRYKKGRSASGEKHGRAKLTDFEVRLIRASDKPQRELAVDFGVGQQQVSHIKNHKRWTHI